VFQIEAARKKAEKDEAALQNKLKFELESQETPEQRRARERAQVEDADLELSNELFQGGGGKAKSASSAIGGVSGISSIPLKTNQDHASFAILVSKRFDGSTAQNISVFYKKLVVI
jgi:hypothetical protein